jgi:hypothetical protein
MTKQQFTEAATSALDHLGHAAHRAIEIWREGGERIAAVAGERWDAAFEQAKPQLDAQTRRNAQNFRKVVGRYWARGFASSAEGAATAVDTFVGTAITGIERAASYAQAKA